MMVKTRKFCLKNILVLLGYPCLNRGKCIQPSVGSWVCKCSECFTGDHCESLMTMCTNETCSSNGFCVEVGPCKTGCVCKDGI
jgi:delta-like protein